MSPRLDSPDTDADIEVRAILANPAISGFTMIAGAGSGKTTSLVKALYSVAGTRGSQFLANRQQVACITYTEIARQEIEDDLASNPIVHVSTIHSFLWALIEPFQNDIRRWLDVHGRADLEDLEAKYDNPKSRLQEMARAELKQRIERRRNGLSRMGDVARFQFGVATSYGQGIVGYSDVLKMVPELIQSKPLFSKVLSRRFPLVFVDESQDTFTPVVDCLRHIAKVENNHFCLGFFGDPEQKIYSTGIGPIELEPGWIDVKKPENFRSPRRVLEVINAIRADADGLVQVSGRSAELLLDGEVTYFVLPTNADRTDLLMRAQGWLAQNSEAGAWRQETGTAPTKILVIAHKMAAGRLGFENLYQAFHGTRLQESFTEGKAWPLTPFLSTLVPLVEAAQSDRKALLPRLRKCSPLLRAEQTDQTAVRATLAKLAAGVQELVTVITDGGMGSIRRALSVAREHHLIELDERLLRLLPEDSVELTEDSEEVDLAVAAYLACDVAELEGYASYIRKESPYSTQQGIKGSECPDVLVVLDDEEGQRHQFSYDKLFGLKALSKKEAARPKGEDTTVDRTRRLLYVCASRATRALAIVFYADQVDAAIDALKNSALPGTDQIVTAEMLSHVVA
jgi:DNA helicase-2/ATP-dependent DNA helicase PcrA